MRTTQASQYFIEGGGGGNQPHVKIFIGGGGLTLLYREGGGRLFPLQGVELSPSWKGVLYSTPHFQSPISGRFSDLVVQVAIQVFSVRGGTPPPIFW